jgi:hypothetical protein
MTGVPSSTQAPSSIRQGDPRSTVTATRAASPT